MLPFKVVSLDNDMLLDAEHTRNHKPPLSPAPVPSPAGQPSPIGQS